jgi:hypothetical protein
MLFAFQELRDIDDFHLLSSSAHFRDLPGQSNPAISKREPG